MPTISLVNRHHHTLLEGMHNQGLMHCRCAHDDCLDCLDVLNGRRSDQFWSLAGLIWALYGLSRLGWRLVQSSRITLRFSMYLSGDAARDITSITNGGVVLQHILYIPFWPDFQAEFEDVICIVMWLTMKYDIRIKISLLYFCHYHTLNGQLKCKIWHHQDISVFLSSSHSYGLLCTLPSSVLVSGGKARYLVVWEGNVWHSW